MALISGGNCLGPFVLVAVKEFNFGYYTNIYIYVIVDQTIGFLEAGTFEP